MHPLDNPAWRALTGVHAQFGTHQGRAARYLAEVAPFAALPDEPTSQDWEDLASLLTGEDEVAALFRLPLEVPDGWRLELSYPCFQMLAPQDPPPPALAVHDIQVLGTDDLDDVLALAELAKPGPFRERTIELGTYLGIRVGGRLAAMAGERMRFDGFTEISGVSTHPRHRGEGLASSLVLELVSRIQARDDVPFLHVAEDNTAGLRLYEHLGFTVRADVTVDLLRPSA